MAATWLIARQFAGATPYRAMNVDIAYTVTSSCWHMTSVYVATERSWRIYTRVVELKDQFLLLMSPRMAHVLPKAGLSADDVATLRGFFAGLDTLAAPPLDPWQPPVEPGMRIEISAPFDLRLRTAAVRHILGTTTSRSVGISVGLVVLAALLVASGPKDPADLALIVCVLVLGVFRLVRAVVRPSLLARRVPAQLRTGAVLTVTNSGLCQNGEVDRSVLRWESFIGAHELPGQVLVMLAKGRFVPIPIDGLSLQDLQTLRTFLANRDWRVALKAVQPEPAGQ
jgi:hypothetical protein